MSQIKIGKCDKGECKHENYTECVDTRDNITKYVCNDCGLVSRNRCEVYSRVVGYLRPVSGWNAGKREEWNERKTFRVGMDKGDMS